VRDENLAAATRHRADALDRALNGEDTTEPYERASAALAEPLTGNGELVAFQLRQLLADFGAMRR
jgi:hypothetical protein